MLTVGIILAAVVTVRKTERRQRTVAMESPRKKDSKLWAREHSAALRGYDDVVRELLEAHADINFGNHNWRTSLHLSVHHGHTAVVKTLLDGGANASLRSSWTFADSFSL